MTVQTLQPILARLFATHGEVELSHVRVFAQLCSLEPGTPLLPILNMEHFFPRKLTVTVRHHDWWFWEDDERLHIRSPWVEICRLPDSVSEFCIELESLQRKKNQIDWIADEMVRNWFFLKEDGTVMAAGEEGFRVDTWSGSSTWEGERWVRDETRPGTNEYYVKTVTWKPNKEMTERPKPRDLSVPESFPVVSRGRSNVSVRLLSAADVPSGLSADETLRRLGEWESDHVRDHGIESLQMVAAGGEQAILGNNDENDGSTDDSEQEVEEDGDDDDDDDNDNDNEDSDDDSHASSDVDEQDEDGDTEMRNVSTAIHGRLARLLPCFR
jgi:hypothetical protein